MSPLYEFVETSPSKRFREKTLQQEGAEPSDDNGQRLRKRRKVVHVTPEKAAKPTTKLDSSSEDYLLSKAIAGLREEYTQMNIMWEQYASYAPPSFELDLEASLSNIDAINDGRSFQREMNIAQRKYWVLCKAMTRSLRETLKENRRKGFVRELVVDDMK